MNSFQPLNVFGDFKHEVFIDLQRAAFNDFQDNVINDLQHAAFITKYSTVFNSNPLP